MRIAIFGGLGFIGAALARRCVEAGHDVTVFDRPGVDSFRLHEIAGRYRLVTGNFAVLRDVLPAIRQMDVVVHAISATVPGSFIKNPANDVEANVLPSLGLFQACAENNVGRVIFISSGGAVYGITGDRPAKESDLCQPIVPYAVSKEMIEKYLAVFSRHHSLDYTVLRLSNPYGPQQRAFSGQGVIAAWLEKLKRGEKLEIWGDGAVVRDYLYIDDVVSAILLAMTSSISKRTFNVGSGVGCSLKHLHEVLESSLQREIPVVYTPGRAVDVPVNVLDITEIRSALDWRPEISLEDGLRRTWAEFGRA
jgi:UDP-glucose 4-epimerase